jgi:hypothetical protein
MFNLAASLSVITPFEVDKIAIPKPFNTLGIFSTPAYCLKPGLLIRTNVRIAGIFVMALYFNAILIVP